MKRSFKIEVDLKFAAVTLFLSALVVFMVYIFSSSAVSAEDSGYVGEYVDEFSPGSPLLTTAPTTTARTTIPPTSRAPVQPQTLPTMEAAKVGTSSDPLITLSYLLNVAMPQLEAALLSKLDPAAFPPSGGTASDTSYVVEELRYGQTVTAKSGSIEIIVRPGTTASCVSPFSEQGLADLTAGNEILNGKDLPINHTLLVPRSDGRGIRITSSTAFIMVRGDYEIR